MWRLLEDILIALAPDGKTNACFIGWVTKYLTVFYNVSDSLLGLYMYIISLNYINRKTKITQRIIIINYPCTHLGTTTSLY